MSNNDFGLLRRGHYYLILVCLSSILTVNVFAESPDNKDKPSQAASASCKTNKPFCGLYCLYGVMKLNGKKIDFNEFIKPEYISSSKGSSLEDLEKAAEDHGMYAEPLGKLTSRELRSSAYPVILHVKSSKESRKYDHFELFLGTEAGKAKIFNYPEPVKLVPFHELAPRWDGTGLVLSADPIDLGSIFAPARNRLVIYAAVVIPVILMVHYGKRKWLASLSSMSWRKSFWLTTAQAAGFVISAMAWGVTYHFVNEEGFLAHANATASVQEAHLSSFIPKADKKKVEQLLNSDTVFVDARKTRDFEAGHLEKAINVPVDANDSYRQKAMAGISKEAPIVIYCQSNGCPYAEKVTKALKADGFSNISIFKGGWNEWETKK